jgi:hypothetical protein
MRPPSPLRSRPDPGCPEIRHAPKGFGKSGRSGVGLPKARWGHSDRLETGTPLGVSVTAAVGAGRSVDGGGVLSSGGPWSGEAPSRLSASKGLFANVPHALHHTVLASAGGPHPKAHFPYRPPREAHLPRPRSVPPAHLTLIPSRVPFSQEIRNVPISRTACTPPRGFGAHRRRRAATRGKQPENDVGTLIASCSAERDLAPQVRKLE